MRPATQPSYVAAVSGSAREYFEKRAQLYLAAGSPDRKAWVFDDGKRTPVHEELSAEGLLERVFGTPRGFAWRLTEAGVERARAGR